MTYYLLAEGLCPIIDKIYESEAKPEPINTMSRLSNVQVKREYGLDISEDDMNNWKQIWKEDEYNAALALYNGSQQEYTRTTSLLCQESPKFLPRTLVSLPKMKD
ncbi:MAG: hypothetical protein M1834_003679 [Cirrosporium novae-zelandiae]|nr:MAG: hypothetical protein M1834_003679 [Cirrosporium novae-zelandiae]